MSAILPHGEFVDDAIVDLRDYLPFEIDRNLNRSDYPYLLPGKHQFEQPSFRHTGTACLFDCSNGLPYRTLFDREYQLTLQSFYLQSK